jgi:CTP:phosphocholine cytidylyltransferase-like protein
MNGKTLLNIAIIILIASNIFTIVVMSAQDEKIEYWQDKYSEEVTSNSRKIHYNESLNNRDPNKTRDDYNLK